MLRGLSINELAAKITANKAAKKDYIADTRTLTLDVVDAEFTEAKGPGAVALVVPDQGRFPILPVAHDQIAARLDIPKKYYQRMLNATPDLLATNVNRWFRENPEPRMIRTLAGRDRAFLSNRYNRIENDEIARAVLPILADIPDVEFVSTEITEKRMYIQAVSPRLQGEVKVGDVVQAGVVISNSEVGLGSVSVAALDWRLRCLNGMISADKFRAYHVGRQIEDNSDLWQDDTIEADDRAVLLKVRDTVRAAVDASRFRERIEKMRALADGRIVGNPVKAVEVLADKLGVSEGEKDDILKALVEGGDLSAWGLLNAVTAQAHTAQSYDRAVEFETEGGALLALPKPEWQRILEAA